MTNANNANNAPHYVRGLNQNAKEFKCNYNILSVKAITKAIIVISS